MKEKSEGKIVKSEKNWIKVAKKYLGDEARGGGGAAPTYKFPPLFKMYIHTLHTPIRNHII